MHWTIHSKYRCVHKDYLSSWNGRFTDCSLHKILKGTTFCLFRSMMICSINEANKEICTWQMNFFKLHPYKRLYVKTFTSQLNYLQLQNSQRAWSHDHRDLIPNRKFLRSYPVRICSNRDLLKRSLKLIFLCYRYALPHIQLHKQYSHYRHHCYYH
jgi:hypothetical protein